MSDTQPRFASAIRLEAVSSRTNGNTEVTSISLQVLSVTLALIALLILAVVDADGAFSVPLTVWFSLQAVSLAIGAVWIRRFSASRSTAPTISPFLLILAVSSFLWEPIARGMFTTGRPLEMLVMHALGAAVWGLALGSLWQKYQGISVLMSLFLAAFSLSAAHQLAVQGLAAAFALIAISWLTVRYWDQLSGRLRGQSKRSGRGFLIPGLAILFVLLAFTGGRHRELMATLNGFLPSSGGTGDSSPHARHGIGNGEMLVAGCENIQSFGPIDEAPFMTDDKPSLYDVFDDTYDEPVMPTNTDRAIALGPEESMVKKEHLHTQTQKANREFSTSRKSKGERRNDVKNINSDALFYVSGRTPLHLRLELYDTFDGISWHAEPEPSVSEAPTMTMVKESGRDWLRLPDRSKSWEFLGPAETHAVKIIQLETNVIPAPLHLHGVHIADVDRIDMFKPGPQGLVRMDRQKLAELVPIHLASRTVHHQQLNQEAWSGSEIRYTEVPKSLRPALTRLAQEWGAAAPRGWTQIESIIRHLRDDFQHDHDFREPAGASSPVLSFLTESRRGADYQFATAAALLLRTLNYPTRVVSGFYADPNDYDVASRHTPVKKEDVHFWTEVRLGNGAWITLEPTPGYEVLTPPLGWWGTMKLLASQTTTILWEFRFACGAGVLLLGGLFWFRHIIVDMATIVNWRLRPGKRSAICAWGIVSRRLRVNGWKIPKGMTSRQLFREIASARPDFSSTLQDFSLLLEREVFGDCPASEHNQSSDCSDRILQLLSRSLCRELARERCRESASRSAIGRHRHSSVSSHSPSVSA
ncbi:MAG TPA: transglutaminase-like domain-containing protein [Planctomicrobium sp.]|nr:transglutaminase-like domain-containing protein [Planctomicrobium sp.]